MLNTTVSILAAIALLMPGFIVTELSVVRSARSSRSDLEIALRAIAYTLVIHLVFAWWTAHLARSVGSPSHWSHHAWALALYVGIVLLVVPTCVGLGLNYVLARSELGEGSPGLLAAALGAGEARDAFDFAFQRQRNEGAWIILELVGHTAKTPKLLGGLYGRGSAIGQTPSAHDVYLQALCLVAEDENGVRRLSARIDPPRGIYVPASQIARIELLPPGDRM
jgi:hypothetical protein